MMKIVRYVIMAVSFALMCYELNKVFTTENADLSDYKNYWRSGVFAIIILIGWWGNYKDKKATERMERHKNRY